MLKWLKQKMSGEQQKWLRAQQLPGTKFSFPKGAKLRAVEEVVLALPPAIITGSETIGSIFLFDDKAEIMLNEKVGAWYVKLKAGMIFSVAKSCEIMLVAEDGRPRLFDVLPPIKQAASKE